MSRCQQLIDSAVSALRHSDPASLYQWVQHLDSEYGRHRYPELLIHQLSHSNIEQRLARAVVSAIEALKLALALQLHTHSRRVLTAACLSRALSDNLHFWQQRGLKQPLWSAAFKKTPATDSYYFTQWCLTLAECRLQQTRAPLTKLVCGNNRTRYWLFLEQLLAPADVSTGSLLENSQNKAKVHLISAETTHWLVLDEKHQNLRKLPLTQLQHWQFIRRQQLSLKQLAELEYLRALSQSLPSISFKAPKPLLTAIKRYTAGSGALAPVIKHIAQRPQLAQSLRLAAAQESMPANDPNRMELKHIYLWLGGSRASIVLATASLQQQFMQQRVPLQQSVMQRFNLLTELLKALSQKTEVALTTPASLLTLLTGADLFRDARLLRSAHWPKVDHVQSADKSAWLGHTPDEDNITANKERLSRQLIARWQLQKPLAPLLSPEHYPNHPLPAMMAVSNVLVMQVFHSGVRLSNNAQQQMDHALTVLKLSKNDLRKVVAKAVSQCHPHSPITELSHSQ